MKDEDDERGKVYSLNVIFVNDAKQIQHTGKMDFRIYPNLQVLTLYDDEKEYPFQDDEKELAREFLAKWLFKHTNNPLSGAFRKMIDEHDIAAWDCEPEFDEQAKKQIRKLYIMEDL